MARYEDTTQFERDVMTSMGYVWRGEGWQRGLSDNEDNMLVEAWVGGPPQKPEPLTNVFEKIADINKPISIHPENDDVVPFGDAAKKIYRDDADKAIGLAAGIASDLEMKIQETDKDITDINSQLSQPQRTESEKANLNLVLSKLKVKKERLNVLRHEANKSRAHEEYNKYFNEEMFMAYDATSWREDYRKENSKKMTEKRQEEQQHLKEAEAARQSVSILEKEQQERQNEVNRLKELDLATEDGLFRAGNEALQNEQNAQNALNDAQNRINQAINQKAEAENIARDYENKSAQAEAKRQKHSNILEEFVKWNTEADYGKEAWWKEYNGWMDSIANLEKERDDAKNAARESVNKVANLLEQANNDKANAENALNNARNTLADIQARKEAIAKAKKEAEDKAEEDRIKDAIKTVADFYKETTEKFGEQSAKVAKELADAAKGSTIKNSDHALQLFEKHRDILNKKFNAKDREAVAKALESVNRDQIARNLAKFSKAFFVTSKGIDAYDLYNEFQKGYKTNNWRPFFVKTESIYAGAAATALTAFAYSIILGTPLGILGYAIIMTLVSVFVNEKFVEKINSALGI